MRNDTGKLFVTIEALTTQAAAERLVTPSEGDAVQVATFPATLHKYTSGFWHL